MTTTVLNPDREDREQTIDEIRRGTIHIVRVSGSSVRTRIAQRDEWDKQIEEDAKAGKLDEIARQVKENYEEGRTTPL